MIKNKDIPEEKILKAAKEIFVIKGYAATRMQEIADKAKINKALLHYYFRSKDKLFEAVFNEAMESFLPEMNDALNSDLSLKEKIKLFVHKYIDVIKKNPQVPSFIIHEIGSNPEKISVILTKFGNIPSAFINSIIKEINEKKIKAIDPKQLITNIIALSIFPFVAKPILKNVMFANENEKVWEEFIEDRKIVVTQFILDAISIK